MIVICLDLWYITGFKETFKTKPWNLPTPMIHIKQRFLQLGIDRRITRPPPWPKKRGESLSRQVYWASWQLCSWGAQLNSGTVGKYLSDSWERTLTYLHENGWVFKYGKYVGFILHPIDALETNISPSTLVLLSGGDFPAFTFGGTC